jgi:hypothetical protein
MVLSRVFIGLSLLASFAMNGAGERKPMSDAWETCSITEGKEHGCLSSDAPRPFNDFLKRPASVQREGDWFTGDFMYDLLEIGEPNVETNWNEVGSMGSRRVRQVRFRSGSGSFAGLVLIERENGMFSPVMKWSGDMPKPSMFQRGGTKILVLEKDFGGNMPMVSTWAWVWHRNGPVRLDLASAWKRAGGRIGPQHQVWAMGLKWNNLCATTFAWQGPYRGKAWTDTRTYEVCFVINGTSLQVKRVSPVKEPK